MDFEDLDALLDLEQDLFYADDESEASKKRSFQDATSAQEAARSLGAAASKRTRTEPSPAAPVGDEDEDDELLRMAAASRPSGMQSWQLGGGDGDSFIEMANTEDQELLAAAKLVPPSQSMATLRSVRQASQQQQQPDDNDAALEAALEKFMLQSSQATGVGTAAASVAGAPGQQQQEAQEREREREGAEEIIPRRVAPPPCRSVLGVTGDYITVTSESGERVYCQLEGSRDSALQGIRTGRRVDIASALRRARGRLLTTNIDSLLAQVDQDNYQRALAEAEADAAATAAAAAAAAGPSTSAAGARAAAAGAGAGAGAARPEASLWVRKYAPATFWDLLSDEQINREVVRWLKQWDPCVFGRPAPALPPASAAGRGPARSGPFKAASVAPDPLGRPEHKIILLAGPPGLGKTTLAHVVARHCGYRPLEINASDDRSGAALTARILDAVEMRSMMGEKRPNCVIIDEIDGAAGGAEGRSAIAALLKIVNAAPAKQKHKGGRGPQPPKGNSSEAPAEEDSDSDGEGEGGEEDGSSGKGRRGGGTAAAAAGGSGKVARRPLRPLLRPIICICNDLYAPALRPLRDVAKIFHFRKPQAERLAQRLQVVCSWEGLHADKSTLRGLVDRTDADIRSCLNTLQFVAKRCKGSGVVRSSDLAGVQVGQKDMTKGAFSVWQDLLQRKSGGGGIGSRPESDAERHSRLFSQLMDFGEHDLVLSGVHENVLGMRYTDVGMRRTAAMLGQLQDADRLLRAAHCGGDFGLIKYIPAALVSVSQLVAGHERPQLQWPKAGAEARRRTAASRALLQGWLGRVEPAVYTATASEAMVQELLPALLLISAPSLRPVSRHLYSPEESAALASLVGAMLAYGLRFAAEGEEEEEEEGGADLAGQRELQLRGVRVAQRQEPPQRFRPHVHLLCRFPGLAQPGRRLPMAIRQLVTHEVDLEAIRRAEALRHGGTLGVPPTQLAGSEAGQQQQQQVGGEFSPGAPRERDANVAAAAAPPPGAAGRTIATLAERMKGAAQKPAVKRAASAPRGTWLDQLKEQRLQKQAASRGRATGGEAGGSSPGKKGKLPVLYVFHEGYTNAVKRPLKIQDLL